MFFDIQTNFGEFLNKSKIEPNSSTMCSNEIPSAKLLHNIKQVYNKAGILGFWKGFSVMSIRAIVVSGSSLTIVEHFKKWVDKTF